MLKIQGDLYIVHQIVSVTTDNETNTITIHTISTNTGLYSTYSYETAEEMNEVMRQIEEIITAKTGLHTREIQD